MAIRSVANFVHSVHNSIDGCIKTNRAVRAAKVVVDGPWKSHHWETRLCTKFHCTCEGSIPPDHHEPVHTGLYQVDMSSLAAFRMFERFAPCRLQNGSTATEDFGHRTNVQAFKIAIDQSLVTLKNPHDF